MKFTVLDLYKSFVENNFIKFDESQIEILKKIQSCWAKYNKNFFFKKKKKQGVYLFGSTGVGKTFLLNLFYQNIKVGKKIHFYNLMNNIHTAVKKSKNKNIAIEEYVKKLSSKYRVLFIDELHIFNIVDALIIKKIFLLFSKYKIFIIISSNFHPEHLYKNGLQRNDFLSFIKYLIENYYVIDSKNSYDYRRQTLNQSKTYFTPINENTLHEFNRLFERFVDTSNLYKRIINTNNRNLTLKKCTSNLLMISFNDICEVNFGNQDYYNIAKNFKLVFLKNVPEFNQEKKDSCRRFISLIDMLYENNCSIVILASKPITSLNLIPSFSKEFERTTSRLYEMTIIKPN